MQRLSDRHTQRAAAAALPCRFLAGDPTPSVRADLRDAIEGAGLQGLRADVLERIARVPTGVPLGAAPWAPSRELGVTPAECNSELQELQNARHLRIEDGDDGNRRVVADYARIGPGLAGAQALALVAPAFEVVGAQGSVESTAKLQEPSAPRERWSA